MVEMGLKKKKKEGEKKREKADTANLKKYGQGYSNCYPFFVLEIFFKNKQTQQKSGIQRVVRSFNVWFYLSAFLILQGYISLVSFFWGRGLFVLNL